MSSIKYYSTLFGYVVCLFSSLEYIKGVVKGSVVNLIYNGQNCDFSVLGYSFAMPFKCFRSQYRSIFIEDEYDFPWEGEELRVLDLGANFGMSCLFFLSRFQQSKVTAFEADPAIFKTLKSNLDNIDVGSRIELFNSAAWIADGVLGFNADGMDGGAVAPANGENALNNIPCTDIKRIMKENKFDVVKIDIEGAEKTLIPYIAEELSDVSLIMFEYHSECDSDQKLNDIFAGLAAQQFRFHIRSEDDVMNPFTSSSDGHGFENRVVIYCYKQQLKKIRN